MPPSPVYLLTGRAESLDAYPGSLLAASGVDVRGRTTADLAPLRFNAQLSVIRSDLIADFWHSGALLIGSSYGAYLLLHTLADLIAFPGSVLLLSPVLGSATSRDGRYASRPPRAKRLMQLAESRGFASPRGLEIHVGAEDHDCDPDRGARFASQLENARCSIVPGAGHRLHDEYVANLFQNAVAQLPHLPREAYLPPNETDLIVSGRTPLDDPTAPVIPPWRERSSYAPGGCPECGDDDIWRVTYCRPLPGSTRAPRTIEGGCCISPGSPDSYCPNCRLRFRRRDVVSYST